MELRYAGATDIGLVKKRNEDSMYFPGEELSDIVVVADGMGGYSAGDVASAIAVQVALNIVRDGRAQGRGDETMVLRAINEANRSILDYAREHEFCEGMGTTMIVALFSEDKVTLGHVGDSRAYVLTPDVFKRVTRDHSYVQSLIDGGRITPEEAQVHPYRNVILRAVGTEEDLDVDIYREPFPCTSRLLVCSDGVTRYLTDEEIAGYMAMEAMEEAVEEMVRISIERGGSDNITVVMAAREGEA